MGQPRILILLAVISVLVSSAPSGSFYSQSISPNSLIHKDKTYSSIINLAKCCPPSHLYKTGLNYCRPSMTGNVVDPSSWEAFLPVHSIKSNETLFHKDLMTFSSNGQFHLTVNPISCAKGFLGKTSTQFQFYEDGTLKLNLDGIGYKFPPEEFCIDRMGVSSSDGDDPPIIVRFCIPSKCADDSQSSGIHCIRKCCPLGSVVNKTSRNCQEYDSSSSLFHHDVNHQLRAYRTGRFVHLDDFTIVDGVPPHCHNDGRQAFNSSQFYLLKDGRMYVPNFPCQSERATEEYCIDHFIYDEQHIQLEGIRCFTKVFTSTDDDSKRSFQVHPYLLLVSSFFLLATIAVYIVIPEIRDNIHGVSTMSYFACTALFYVSLAMIKLGVGLDQNKYETNSFCRPLAICAHFYFLSTFTWLNVVCFDLWWTFKTLEHIDGKNRRHFDGRTFCIYSMYAWGIPLVIVLVGQLLDLIELDAADDSKDADEIIRPKFGFSKCWFMCKESFLVYLYVPVAVLIMFNIIFFCLTAVLFHKTSTEVESAVSGSRNAKQRYCVIFNLFILMGISWSTEVVSFVLDGSFYSWFLTDLINSLMGFIIFIIFVCKARIGRLLVQNCSCLNKLLSCVNFTRGRTLHRRRQSSSSRTSSSAISIFQKLRSFNSESSSSNISHHSVEMIMSSFKIAKNNNKKRESPSVRAVTAGLNLICISPDSSANANISNHSIESITFI